MLRELLQQLQIEIDAATEAQLLRYLDELLRWNQSINLTAIDDRDEAIEKHLADSLTLLPMLGSAQRLLDMGSGAGLPGLALKIARPGLHLTSVDAVAKKISFQRHVTRLLGLSGVEALHGRLEELGKRGELVGKFDLVTARAFSSLTECARLARPFLLPGGRLLAMKGPEGEEEVRSAALELLGLGYEAPRVVALQLPKSRAKRLLIELTSGSLAVERG